LKLASNPSTVPSFPTSGGGREGGREGGRANKIGRQLTYFYPSYSIFLFFFFLYTGITDLKFKPAYNPYTEPSMEIFGYHPDLKKYVDSSLSLSLPPSLPPQK